MKYIFIYLLFTSVFMNHGYSQNQKRITLIPIESAGNDWKTVNSINYENKEADSIMALICNDNLTVSFSDDFKVFISINLYAKSYIVTSISQNYATVLLNSFNDTKVDWAGCIMLYQILNMYGLNLLPYAIDSNKWREERKEKDFFNIYFKILEMQ